jgi:hypothetical protein
MLANYHFIIYNTTVRRRQAGDRVPVARAGRAYAYLLGMLIFSMMI